MFRTLYRTEFNQPSIIVCLEVQSADLVENTPTSLGIPKSINNYEADYHGKLQPELPF
jgi:hypothetical protein